MRNAEIVARIGEVELRMDVMAASNRAEFDRVIVQIQQSLCSVRDEILATVRSETGSEFSAVRSGTAAEFAGVRSETATEFAAVRSEMATEFAAVRSEMATEFAAARSEMATEFRAVRSEMATGFAGLRSEMADMREELQEEMHALHHVAMSRADRHDEAIAELRRHMLVLHEDLISRISLLGDARR